MTVENKNVSVRERKKFPVCSILTKRASEYTMCVRFHDLLSNYTIDCCLVFAIAYWRVVERRKKCKLWLKITVIIKRECVCVEACRWSAKMAHTIHYKQHSPFTSVSLHFLPNALWPRLTKRDVIKWRERERRRRDDKMTIKTTGGHCLRRNEGYLLSNIYISHH